MKKTITILTMLFMVATTKSQSIDSIRAKMSIYASAGISLGQGTFLAGSYPSAEVGLGWKNLTLGGCLGRTSLEPNSQYFWEPKVTASIPFGPVSGYVLFGYGGYFQSDQKFVEYGAGISYCPNRFGVFLQYSNWDSQNYISAGVTVMIKK